MVVVGVETSMVLTFEGSMLTGKQSTNKSYLIKTPVLIMNYLQHDSSTINNFFSLIINCCYLIFDKLNIGFI